MQVFPHAFPVVQTRQQALEPPGGGVVSEAAESQEARARQEVSARA